MNHTIGFKKFSDYQLESTPDDTDSLKVGLSTELSAYGIVAEQFSIVDMNCVEDFDSNHYLGISVKFY